MRNTATLPILNKIEQNDIVVLELDSWQCQGFGDNKISPDISVFTNIMNDHMNYYKNDTDKYLDDKSNIYKYQKKSDILVTSMDTFQKLKVQPKSQIIIPTKKLLEHIKKVDLNIFGKHNIQNTAFAIEVAKQFGLNGEEIIQTLQTFKGLEGRLEIVENDKCIVINDNNATTPEAAVAGIKAVREK
jgi:UDP-N-acetylmuramoylalanine--D-glutamate ligase